ncbi:hypothetical protein BT96DRAFT_949522 [Gymnopus androsaceus JB14]|uniref:Uncharacterized protein n=1 Tax=Gymnopus androsaceus JB14 TaxID=1447944 RepID=A0A6A4GKX3_9AGAR|nr:hypothetical protein BT96DRAFT_949522 [Gymnopus androsaceus JB14]
MQEHCQTLKSTQYQLERRRRGLWGWEEVVEAPFAGKEFLFHEELFRKSSSEWYLWRNKNDNPEQQGKTQNHNVVVDDAFEGVGESEGGRLWETRIRGQDIPGIAKGVADKSVSPQGMRWPATAAGVAGVFEKVYSHDRTSKEIHIEMRMITVIRMRARRDRHRMGTTAATGCNSV